MDDHTTEPSGAVLGSDAVDLTAYAVADRTTGLNEQVYSTMREAILSGAYKPGHRINIKPISAQLGVSHMPVLVALARLSAEGALDVVPRSGFRIPHLTSETFRELVVMRIRLETLAGEYSATQTTINDLRIIGEAYEDMVEAEQKSRRELLSAHRRFHFSVYAVSGKRHLIQTIEGLWLKLGPQVYASIGFERKPFRGYHQEILNALKAGDPSAVATAIRNDIADTLGPDDTREKE